MNTYFFEAYNSSSLVISLRGSTNTKSPGNISFPSPGPSSEQYPSHQHQEFQILSDKEKTCHHPHSLLIRNCFCLGVCYLIYRRASIDSIHYRNCYSLTWLRKWYHIGTHFPSCDILLGSRRQATNLWVLIILVIELSSHGIPGHLNSNLTQGSKLILCL